MLMIDQLAPQFTALAVVDGGEFKQIKLSDYKGKWVVLYFYPLDFTFVCPTELKDLNKSYEEISDILRLPMGTVAVRINRAKFILKKICQTKR